MTLTCYGFHNHETEGIIGEGQTRNQGLLVEVSSDVGALVGAEGTVSDFVNVIFSFGIGHLNLEPVAVDGVKLVGHHKILPGFSVVLNRPAHVIHAPPLFGGIFEAEALESGKRDGRGIRVRRRDRDFVSMV
nr:sporamin [Ipomoea batatas]